MHGLIFYLSLKPQKERSGKLFSDINPTRYRKLISDENWKNSCKRIPWKPPKEIIQLLIDKKGDILMELFRQDLMAEQRGEEVPYHTIDLTISLPKSDSFHTKLWIELIVSRQKKLLFRCNKLALMSSQSSSWYNGASPTRMAIARL